MATTHLFEVHAREGAGAGVSVMEVLWCVECARDEMFELPEGADAPEAFCLECGTAVFLWTELVVAQPAASIATPMSAVATPAA